MARYQAPSEIRELEMCVFSTIIFILFYFWPIFVVMYTKIANKSKTIFYPIAGFLSRIFVCLINPSLLGNLNKHEKKTTSKI